MGDESDSDFEGIQENPEQNELDREITEYTEKRRLRQWGFEELSEERFKELWCDEKIPNVNYNMLQRMKTVNCNTDPYREIARKDINRVMWYNTGDGEDDGYSFDVDYKRFAYKDIELNSDSDDDELRGDYVHEIQNNNQIEREAEKNYRPGPLRFTINKCGVVENRCEHWASYPDVVSVYETKLIDDYLDNWAAIDWGYPNSRGQYVDHTINYLNVLHFLKLYMNGDISNGDTNTVRQRFIIAQKLRNFYDYDCLTNFPLLCKILEQNRRCDYAGSKKKSHHICFCVDYNIIKEYEDDHNHYVSLNEPNTSELEQFILQTSTQGSHKVFSNRFLQNDSKEIQNQLFNYTYTGKFQRKTPRQKKVCLCLKKRRKKHFQKKKCEYC